MGLALLLCGAEAWRVPGSSPRTTSWRGWREKREEWSGALPVMIAAVEKVA